MAPPPGSRAFSPEKDIPDLKGKVILVTGGTSGLGQECILQFAKHKPSQIFFTARSIVKGKETMAKIEKVVPDAKLTFVQLDLTSLASVEDAAKTVIESTDRLDILMNNAGIMMAPAATTKDGYEIQFGTNHMGHALLTKLLLPTLLNTSKKPRSDVRIIHLSSGAHSWAPKEGIVFSEVKTKQSNISNHARYAQSKLANVLFSNELARRYPDLTCVSLHPGSVDTGLSRGVMKSFPILTLGLPLLQWSGLMTVSVQEGVLTQLWAATSKDVKSGKYYEPVAREVEGSPFLKDEKLGEKLWDFTMEECNTFLRLPREKKVKHVRILEPEDEGSWFAVIPPVIAVLLICYVVKLIMVGLSEQTRAF